MSGSPNDMSRPVEGTSRRSHRVVPLLLRFHQTSQGTEIRAPSQDPSHAGGIDHQAANVQGDLLLGDAIFSSAKYHVGVLRLGHVG